MEAVAFPLPEVVYRAYLSPLLGVPVAAEVPNPRPASFVRVVRAGGNARDLVTDSAVVVFEAWAPSQLAAGELGRRMAAYVRASAQSDVGGAWIRSVSDVAGLQYSPDPTSEVPRYLYTAEVRLRVESLRS